MHEGLQVFLTLFLLAAFAVLGLFIYRTVSAVLTQSQRELSARNVNVSRSGATIGVKSVDREKYLDSTQRVLADAWNKSEATGTSFAAPSLPSSFLPPCASLALRLLSQVNGHTPHMGPLTTHPFSSR